MSARRPNIVWFITDDTNHRMLGCYGGNVLSPRIDRIAADGLRFTNFYCAAPACTPSRYNYLTGHYASRCPSEAFPPPRGEPSKVWFNTDLDPAREPSIGHAMQAAGYTTGFVGKWHVGGGRRDLAAMPGIGKNEAPRDPAVNSRMRQHQQWLCAMVRKNGFDSAASVINGNHQTIPEMAARHNLEWTAKGALDFIDQARKVDKPFFLNVATTTIHGPDHAASLMGDPRLTAGGYADDHLGCLPERRTVYERLRDAAGVEFNSTTAGVLWMDDLFGAVLDRVRKLGLEQDTIVVWSTDHGFSGGKFSTYEAGLRIPFLIQWRGHLPEGRTVNATCQTVDLLPTLLDLADAQPPEGMTIDGRSMVPLLRDPGCGGEIRSDVYSEFGYTRAVRRGRWKYMAMRLPDGLIQPLKRGETDTLFTHFGKPLPRNRHRPTLMTPLILNHPCYFDPDQLYDLESDPCEQRNLAGLPEHANTLARMRSRLREHLEAIDPTFPLEKAEPFYGSARFAELRDRTFEALRRHEAEYWRICEAGGFYAITRGFYGLPEAPRQAEGDAEVPSS